MAGETYGQGWVSPANNNYSANQPAYGSLKNSGGAGLSTAGMIGATTSAITTVLGVSTMLYDMDRQNEAIKDSMESAIEASKFKQNQQSEQVRDLERITGDKLTASGLEELKAESRLKAGQAETGGTANADVATTTGMNKLHRDAVIRREGEVAVKNSMNAMTSEQLNLDNKLTMMASRTTSPLGGFLKTMNSGISGFNNGLAFMGTNEKQALFNINPSYQGA